MRKIVWLVPFLALGLVACNEDDATIAEANMTKAADNFEVNRRIAFINTWTDAVLLEAVGYCNVDTKNAWAVIKCKTGKGADDYYRHLMLQSGHVTAVVEQLEPQPVNVYHYRVTLKPQSFLPDYDMRLDFGAVGDALTPDNSD